MKHLIIFLISFCIFTSCRGKPAVTQSIGTGAAACSVSVYTISQFDSTPFLSSFGTITFKQKTDISCSTEGRIKEIRIQEGDLVKQGDPMVSLENLQLEIRKEQVLSELTSADAALALSEARYQEGRFQVEGRLLTLEKLALQANFKEKEVETYGKIRANKRELLAADGISQEEMREVELHFLSLETEYFSLLKDIETASIGLRKEDILNAGIAVPEDEGAENEILIDLNTRTLQAEVGAARARLESARAELLSVDLLLSALSITAEKDGVIGAVYHQEGENVAPGTILLTLFQASPMYVQFTLPVAEGKQLFHGQLIEAHLPALGSASMRATIEIISPTIDPQSGTISIKALIENKENLLKPGMFVSLHIEPRVREDRILIPAESLTTNNEKRNTVFIIKNGKAFAREIIIGSGDNGRVEIHQGLALGDTVIVSPPACVVEGKDVQILEQ